LLKRILAQQHKTFASYYLQQSYAGAFYKVYKVYKKKALSQEVRLLACSYNAISSWRKK